jgi:hypothetical protein
MELVVTARGSPLHWLDVLVLVVFALGVVSVVLVPFTIDVLASHKTYRELVRADAAAAVRADEPHGMQGLARASMAFAVIVVIGFALAYILVRRPFGDNKTVVGNIMVALTTTLASITAFYFGSRLSSQAHRDAAAALGAATRAAAAGTPSQEPATRTIAIVSPTSPTPLLAAPGVALAPIRVETTPPGERVIGFVASGDDDGRVDQIGPGQFRYVRGPDAGPSVTLAFQLADGSGRSELVVDAPAP